MMRNLLLALTALVMPFIGISPALAAGRTPLRAVQIDLDYIYDENPEQTEKNLQAVIDRVKTLGINAVFLQAFANPEGDGIARQLYFSNHSLPVRSDLFAVVVRRLQKEAGVKVFGWLPVLSFGFDASVPRVLTWNEKTDAVDLDGKAYLRVSPFDQSARRAVVSLYEDMAKAAPIDGILFHDDATLSDFEDASPQALNAYRKAGLPASIKAIRAKPRLMAKWAKFKTNALISFTQDIAKHVRAVRPQIATVRNLYAPVALMPESQNWFAQNYDAFLKAYDYTAVMAMPHMENVPEDVAETWMNQLITVAGLRPQGLHRTFFELQSVDWNKQAAGENRAIPTEQLAIQMRVLKQHDALNFGYYPDDFAANVPDAVVLSKDFSLQTDMTAP